MSNDNYNGHTILIVEDDESVLELAVNMFEFTGYSVLTANNAASGIETFRNHPEIDLIFSDLILPGGVTGIEMAKTILNEKPGTLFLLVTGYSDKGKALLQKTQQMPNVEFIAKPYDIDAVTEKVDAMIAERPVTEIN